MQTFLPYPSFVQSAISLDKRRCWKQVVEAHQIINCLQEGSKGWKNHPAVLMWRGYVSALIEYHNTFLAQCIAVHKIRVKKLDFRKIDGRIEYPKWLGDEEFHRSHRSNLLRKNEQFYRRFGWVEPLDLPYIWPAS